MTTMPKPTTTMAAPASWAPVNSTSPCEQTSTARCEQAVPVGAMRTASHPPRMTAARAAIVRAVAPQDRGPPEAPGGEDQGAGLVATWETGARGCPAGSAGAGAGGAAADLLAVGASTAGTGVVTIW